MRVMPSPWFIVITLVLLIGGAGTGFVGGLTWEANKRDAQELRTTKDSMAFFMHALERGKSNVRELIEWRQKARIYYRNWQKGMNDVPDTQLAQCAPSAAPGTGAAPGTVVLSADFVRLYNDAWLPAELNAGDTSGAAGEIVEANPPSVEPRRGVTPREVLENTQLNAELCGDDRKRLDKLIDQLQGK